jgi:hypothetical protein
MQEFLRVIATVSSFLVVFGVVAGALDLLLPAARR